MHGGGCQWQEKHQKHLGMDGPLDFSPGQPYLLHDSEPALVVISFRYLLIIDNQYGGHHKQGAKEYSQE